MDQMFIPCSARLPRAQCKRQHSPILGALAVIGQAPRTQRRSRALVCVDRKASSNRAEISCPQCCLYMLNLHDKRIRSEPLYVIWVKTPLKESPTTCPSQAMKRAYHPANELRLPEIGCRSVHEIARRVPLVRLTTQCVSAEPAADQSDAPVDPAGARRCARSIGPIYRPRPRLLGLPSLRGG